jgi:hypothetical protein
MATYLYFSVMPESLVASMLPPEEFGTYLAVGTRRWTRGQAMFFDLKEEFPTDDFDFSLVAERCVPHPDGQPKHSLYLGIYRVLERVPLEAFNSLWVVTPGGHVLELKQASLPAEFPGKFHLYQEICPLHPLVASSLPPDAFCRFITDPAKPISVPRIFFVELELAELADDPEHGQPTNLPYAHMDHVRDCLMEVQRDASKDTKTVDRIHPQEFPYRCVKSGFYLGDPEQVLYYPFPSEEELQSKYYSWWRYASR